MKEIPADETRKILLSENERREFGECGAGAMLGFVFLCLGALGWYGDLLPSLVGFLTVVLGVSLFVYNMWKALVIVSPITPDNRDREIE